MKGILGYTEDDVVSTDFIGDSRSHFSSQTTAHDHVGLLYYSCICFVFNRSSIFDARLESH